MKKFRLITALTLVLMLALGTPLSAMAASWDVTDSAGVANAFATDTDAEVIINMQNDINMEHYLDAGADQTYTINGNGHTISDVMLDGEGSVEINADVTAEDNYAALQASGEVDVQVTGDVTGEYSAVEAYDGASVTVEGDVTGEYSAIEAYDGASVTVEGDVTAEDGNAIIASGEDTAVDVTGDVSGKYNAVDAYDGASVTVEGDVTSEDGAGVFAYDDGTTVDVTGEITAKYDGVSAGNGADITVEGDVTSEAGDAIYAWGEGTTVDVTGDVTGINGIVANESAEVNVTGDVTAEFNDEYLYAGSGVVAMDDAVVTVDGNVAGGDAVVTDEAQLENPEYSLWGGAGVEVNGEATVTVTGDVTGGDGAGTAGYGGSGVSAGDEASVTVEGNVTGGDVIADPDVEALYDEYVIDAEGNTEKFYYNVSEGGNGIYASADATVTVGGDVTGGSTNGDHGNGGAAIYLNDYNYMEDALYEGTGKIDVKGTATGGAAGEGGEGGAALFFSTMYGFLPAGDVDFEEVLNTPASKLTEEQIAIIDFMINNMMNNGDLTVDEVNQVVEDVFSQITDDMTDDEIMALYYGSFQELLLDKDPDFEAMEEMIPSFGEITVGTLSDKNGPKVNSTAGQAAAERYAKEMVKELVPTGENPRTGDGFSGMLVVLMVLSAFGVCALLTQRKRFV